MRFSRLGAYVMLVTHAQRETTQIRR